MTKYIAKEQALEAILSTVELTGEQWIQVWNKIKSIPAADVVEVVLCLDCKHMRTISGEGWGIDTKLYYCGENEILVSPVGYCSDGKRRNESESDD